MYVMSSVTTAFVICEWVTNLCILGAQLMKIVGQNNQENHAGLHTARIGLDAVAHPSHSDIPQWRTM